MQPDLLAVSTRGNEIENLHFGWVCLTNKNKKVVYKKGDIKNKIFLRSIAKPVQAIPFLENNIPASEKELALMCASHCGSEEHLKILHSFAKKNNISLSNLKCGKHLPSDDTEKKLILSGKKKLSTLHNNCSGKHTGMLCVCKINGWKISNYNEINHPLQKEILKKIKHLSHTNDISIGIDGCSVPTFSLPIVNISYIFLNLIGEKNKYHKITNSMRSFPYLIGGENKIDSEIINSSKGNLIAKVGAEGVMVIFKNDSALVIKISDGSPQIRSTLSVKLLLKLGWLSKKEIKNTILEEIALGEIKNLSSKKVGLVRCNI